MPKVTFLDHTGTELDTIEVEVGTNIMQAALDGGIEGISAECGGACSCATCHCYIDDAWLERARPAEGMERDLLQCVPEPKDSSRLSCQVDMTDDLDGLVVQVPESQY